MGTFQTGNTFDRKTVSVGHARKVWRRIEEQLPGGFLVSNVADFVADGNIPCGSALVVDTAKKTAKVLKPAEVTGEAVATINGFSDRDIPIESASTIATVNAVVKGEIYGYMLTDAAATAIKGMNQLNGMSIRVID